jgi:hypothetical protein
VAEKKMRRDEVNDFVNARTHEACYVRRRKLTKDVQAHDAEIRRLQDERLDVERRRRRLSVGSEEKEQGLLLDAQSEKLQANVRKLRTEKKAAARRLFETGCSGDAPKDEVSDNWTFLHTILEIDLPDTKRIIKRIVL